DSAFATQHASRFVESQHAVETAAIDQLAAGIETRAPITAAKAIGKQRTWRGSSKNCRHLVVPGRFVDVMVGGLRVTAPRKYLFSGRRGCDLFAQGCG